MAIEISENVRLLEADEVEDVSRHHCRDFLRRAEQAGFNINVIDWKWWRYMGPPRQRRPDYQEA